MTDQTDRDQLDDEAIDWVVRLHSGAATDGDHAAFARWRAQSAGHEAAAREAEDTWKDIGQTATAKAFGPDIDVGRRARVSRRVVLAAAAAASIGGLTLMSGVAGPTTGLLADYRTRRGERRREVLPDRSTVWLNTETALSLDFSPTERRLTLHAGEALFAVRNDDGRPFIVTAGRGDARALGTVYAMRVSGSETTVTVVEGVVGVRSGIGDEVRLNAGQRTRYASGRFVAGVETIDGDAATAWPRGKLIFNQRPLGEVVAELQRHRYARLIVTDAALAATPITGVVDLDDDAATFGMLDQALPLEIVRLPFVTLLRRPSP